MDRPAQLDFALDIDDLASAGPHLAGDASRPAECEAADLHDAQAIDLTDARPSMSISATFSMTDLS